ERGAIFSMWMGERLEPLEPIPAMVFAAMDDVHFLDAILPDISQPQIAGETIEAEAPRIAKTVGPDFRLHAGLATKRIVGGNGIRRAGLRVIHVNAQQFSEQELQVLRVTVWIVVRP